MKKTEGILIYKNASKDESCICFKIDRKYNNWGWCISEEVKKEMGGSTMILDCDNCEFAIHRKAKK